MKRYIAVTLVAAGFLGATQKAWSQQQSEKQVSGPEQTNSQKSTGKSYKKGTKKPAAKENNPKTGQTHRLGNTGDLTKNGDDVNGRRAEGSGKSTSTSAPNSNK